MRATDIRPPDYWTELPGTEAVAPAVTERPSRPAGPPAAPEAWDDAPSFVISVAAQMVGLHAQTLRYYERAGLVTPARSKGNIRLYRRSDVDRLRLIQKLIADHGVNLAGVELVLRMEERIRELQRRLDALADEMPGAGAGAGVDAAESS